MVVAVGAALAVPAVVLAGVVLVALIMAVVVAVAVQLHPATLM